MTPDLPKKISAGERSWAMSAHLSALSLYLGLIFANLLCPYLIWRWKHARSDFVAAHALTALNFQITVTIAGLIAVLMAIFIPLLWTLVVLIGTTNIILLGKAADRARNGQRPRYPFTVKWIR